jgi:5-hydroxyisourate hydrolase
VSQVTTHVLDCSTGQPAAGVRVVLEQVDEPPTVLGQGTTDDAGRVTGLGPDRLERGFYRLRFDVLDYFARHEVDSFFLEVTVAFSVSSSDQHYPVPLLLSPFGYSTYRGS